MQARSDQCDIDDLDARIEQWVADLGADASGVAENARHCLASLGSQVLDRVIAAVPGLDYFGRLCAIEIFAEPGARVQARGCRPASADRLVQACWPVEQSGGVSGLLAEYGQAVLYFRLPLPRSLRVPVWWPPSNGSPPHTCDVRPGSSGFSLVAGRLRRVPA